MKQFLVLMYDLNELDVKLPRILYSGSDAEKAVKALKNYQTHYPGYHIALVEVPMPQK